jgi:endonuclease/exonuclease/phosphatase family metal-dependent hydrolase
LSAEPDKPGVKGWDAACPRVVTWARPRPLTGETLVAFNTHFDHVEAEPAASAARPQYPRIAGQALIVLTGDFNYPRRPGVPEARRGPGNRSASSRRPGRSSPQAVRAVLFFQRFPDGFAGRTADRPHLRRGALRDPQGGHPAGMVGRAVRLRP